MANVTFDQFTDGGEMQVGDMPVGLRSSDLVNYYKFNFPGLGIRDANGNYLFEYGSAGTLGVNHLKFFNSLTGLPALLTADGPAANIDLAILPKGTLGFLYLSGLRWPISDGLPGSSIITDGSGNLSFSSSSSSVLDITGTLNQVLVNGTTGSPQTGNITLTLPQDISPANSPTFSNLILSNLTANAVICGGTTSASSLQSIPSVGIVGQVLTSNGADLLPSMQNIIGKFLGFQIFKVSGTYTPTPGMTQCIIQCLAAGGAGGGTPTANSAMGCGGAGGGAGGFSQSYVTAATIGASQVVTVGLGGVGVSNANGGNGGNTSVGVIITANGGTGGIKGTPTSVSNISLGAGSQGGTSSVGDIVFSGGSGSPATFFSGGGVVSGYGGNSIWASGAIGVSGINSPGINAPANSGAGGSGSIVYQTIGVSEVGGNGGSGLVIIYEFS